MKASKASRFSGLGPALLLWILFATSALLLRPLCVIDETRYVTVAWEMWTSGDFLVPHLNGETYSHKPPLLFWLINLSWVIFGVSEGAARVIGPLAGLGTLVLTALAARRLWPERPDLAAETPFLLLACLLFPVSASMTMFDALQAFFLTGAFLAVVAAWRHGGVMPWIGFGVALGLALLAKGPVALLHALLVPLTAPIWMGRRSGRSWLRWYGGILIGIAVGAGIALAWALPAAGAGGQAYGNAILWGQTAGRVAGDEAPHARDWWYYFAMLPLLVVPLSLWLPFYRGLAEMSRAGADRPMHLLIVWIAGIVLLFSALSGKQPHYLMPMMPAVALLAARASADFHRWKPAAVAAVVAAPAALLGIAFMTYPGLFHWAGWPAGSKPSAGMPPAEVANPGVALAELATPSLALAGGALLLAVVIYGLGVRHRRTNPPAGLAALQLATLIAVHAAGHFTIFERYEIAAFSRTVAEYQTGGIAYDRQYHGEFGFLGRLTTKVDRVSPPEFRDWLSAHPDGILILKDPRPDMAEFARLIEEIRYRGKRLSLWVARPTSDG